MTANFGRIRSGLALGLALSLACAGARAGETVSRPFVGVTHIVRSETSPRPVKMHVLVIDPRAPGVRFLVTPPGGRLDTVKQTTLAFLTRQKAQAAVNAHYFEPWPPPKGDDGAADLVGLAASGGKVYSPFDANPPKPYAIRPDAPGLNIDPRNRLSIVHRATGDASGRSVAENVTIGNAIAGNEQLLTAGKVTAGTGKWDNTPNPLTVVGIADGNSEEPVRVPQRRRNSDLSGVVLTKPEETPDDVTTNGAGGHGSLLVILIVDGRQAGVSEGLSTREAAELLRRDYGVTDAINLDGGGSTTLCLADPGPRVANVPVGIDNVPGTLRPVGSSLAVFATTMPATRPAGENREMDITLPPWVLWAGLGAACAIAAGVVMVVLRRRKTNAPGG